MSVLMERIAFGRPESSRTTVQCPSTVTVLP